MKRYQPQFLWAGLLVVCAAVLFFADSAPALAQSEWIVHSFRTVAQGLYPMGTLVADSAGNLYGTTQEGGTSKNWGVVYELVRPVPPKTAWTETVLYSFTGGVDGSEPLAGLIFDKAGNLYGTTSKGGDAGAGTVFELAAPAVPGGAWTESVLHSFQPVSGDGEYPETGLSWDHSGNLVGVTTAGGVKGTSSCGVNCGTVFQLSPPATPGGAWTETIIHNFKYGQGVTPRGTPAVAANGTLYGTTYWGGLYGEGVFYRLTPPATPGGAWTYRVLHAFTGGFDGQAPRGALTLRGKGVLYGTSGGGGAYAGGMVFQFVPPTVPGGAWTENVLCSFGSATGDGEGPTANVIFDSAGNMYGITVVGGTANGGTVFRCAPPASPGGDWTETILHSFHDGNLNDGATPSGGLILGKNGVLFGVTQSGGTNGEGTVYGVTK
jgi:uncharacterized repeat protein (TIGR03803 family)